MKSIFWCVIARPVCLYYARQSYSLDA